MNSYEYISLEEMRDNIKLQLKAFYTTTDDDFIDKKLIDANRKLISQKQFIYKTEVLDIVDYKAQLPCDFYRLMAFVVNNGTPSPYVYSDVNFFNGNDVNIIQGEIGTKFMIQEGYIFFPSNYESLETQIVYQAYNQDADGFPKMLLLHQDYYLNFVCYWYLLREGNPAFEVYKRQMSKEKHMINTNEAVDKFRLEKANISDIIYSTARRYGSLYSTING